MAHFAKLDENNVVVDVVVVANDVPTADGPLGENDMHPDGESWCAQHLGGTWKQTSYNGNIRKNFAGKGFTYDEDRDAFIPPKPFNSWTLNETTCLWEAPVSYPTDNRIYNWNEENTSWDLIEA